MAKVNVMHVKDEDYYHSFKVWVLYILFMSMSGYFSRKYQIIFCCSTIFKEMIAHHTAVETYAWEHGFI